MVNGITITAIIIDSVDLSLLYMLFISELIVFKFLSVLLYSRIYNKFPFLLRISVLWFI